VLLFFQVASTKFCNKIHDTVLGVRYLSGFLPTRSRMNSNVTRKNENSVSEENDATRKNRKLYDKHKLSRNMQ
jgi:hypothetical protein